MSEVNLQLVREYFELHRFQVLTLWEQAGERGTSAAGSPEAAPRLLIEQPGAAMTDMPFLLRGADVEGIARAVVEVRAWHADRFYASMIEANPVLGRVASAECRAQTEAAFANTDFRTVLVISELPAPSAARTRALGLLEALGVDHVMEFATILRGMLEKVHPHGQYAPSATLQTLRLLKRYDLVRRQQLELPFPVEAPVPTRPPVVETSPAPEPEETGDS